MEFDEKELRREISYAIKNIHGIRHVLGPGKGAEPWKAGCLVPRHRERSELPSGRTESPGPQPPPPFLAPSSNRLRLGEVDWRHAPPSLCNLLSTFAVPGTRARRLDQLGRGQDIGGWGSILQAWTPCPSQDETASPSPLQEVPNHWGGPGMEPLV